MGSSSANLRLALAAASICQISTAGTDITGSGARIAEQPNSRDAPRFASFAHFRRETTARNRAAAMARRYRNSGRSDAKRTAGTAGDRRRFGDSRQASETKAAAVDRSRECYGCFCWRCYQVFASKLRTGVALRHVLLKVNRNIMQRKWNEA